MADAIATDVGERLRLNRSVGPADGRKRMLTACFGHLDRCAQRLGDVALILPD